MFRLVFLAFHGERRHGHGESAHGHGGHGSGHGGHGVHDAPPSMAIPLVVLAIGSVFAGYLGVPHALGGSNRIEQFLHPSFEAHQPAPAEPLAVALTQPAAEGGVQASEDHASTRTELMLMGVSTGIAFAGIGVAAFFWLRNPDAAGAMAARFRSLYVLLSNKYYVDEIYDAVIVQPIKLISTRVLWRTVDAAVIDGAVNGVGAAVSGSSSTLRRVQTGSVRTYAAGVFVGVVLIVGYYLAG
jgi:NADH-quinone oxidoreductase subunit L